MDRAARISGIIEKRKPLAKKIERVEKNLRSLQSGLQALETQRQQIVANISDLEIKERLSLLNLEQLQTNIINQLDALTHLQAYFSRDTLNIGVVGLMRQGKSTLLQSLTGLNDDVIPARHGGACTAVKSKIRHRDYQDTEARITFHSKNSIFQEVILPFYQELNLSSFPANFDDFTQQNLGQLISEDSSKDTIFKRLKHDYHNRHSQYSQWLGKSEKIIPKAEISRYVSHAEEQTQNCIDLAVREAEIYTSFPNVDVGQLTLVDLPGLGDFKSGDKWLLETTLKSDVDVILFVRRPDPTGDAWKLQDTELYKTAQNVLNNLSKRAFLVLNQLGGEQSEISYQACKNFKQKLDNGQVAMQFVASNIVDCSDPIQANQVLDNVISYLGEEIEKRDLEYCQDCQVQLNQLQQEINTAIQKANNSFAGKMAQNSAEFSQFNELFNKFWSDLRVNLQKLLQELIATRDEEDNSFKGKVNDVVEECKRNTGIPDTKKIEDLVIAANAPNTAYDQLRHEIRANLSEKFLSMDEGLKQSIEDTKSEVANVLISIHQDRGGLGNLTDKKGSEFLHEISEQIPESESKIKFGFQVLATFDLVYRGLVQHRIRKNLDVLTPTSTSYKLQTDNWLPFPMFAKDKKPAHQVATQQIHNNLTKAYQEAVNKCEKDLNGLLSEPSQAGFAIVEEFVDRVIRAEDVETEWRNFLWYVRSDVWRDEFGVLAYYSKLQKQWEDALIQVSKINRVEQLTFV